MALPNRAGQKSPCPGSCTAPAHRALQCGACHDAWAPQCLGCHTRFDDAGVRFDLLDQAERPGQWQETPGAQLAEPATLGVRTLDGGRRVEEFVPGMVLTLDLDQGPPLFRRLFAPLAPHTIRREARPCLACHASPVALGYGRGELSFDRASRRWRFRPARPLAADGLPEDAWVGFLAAPRPHRSTREDARAFDVEEQRRILAVGACLGCHAGDSTVMREAQKDFAGTAGRLGPRCVVPAADRR